MIVDPLLLWGLLLLLGGTALALAGAAWLRAGRAQFVASHAEALAVETASQVRLVVESLWEPTDGDTAAYADLAAAVRAAGTDDEPATERILVPGLRPSLPRPGQLR